MSRRFGRNQRRKLRAALEAQNSAVEHLAKKAIENAQRASDAENELRRWNRDTIELLAAQSAHLREIPCIEVRGQSYPITQAIVDNPRERAMFWGAMNVSPSHTRYQLLNYFDVRCDEDAARDYTNIRLIQHTHNRDIGDRFVYSVANHMIYATKDIDMLVALVAREFKQRLVARQREQFTKINDEYQESLERCRANAGGH